MKRCPFCNSENVGVVIMEWSAHQCPSSKVTKVRCKACGATGPSLPMVERILNSIYEDVAKEKWNTRVGKE